MRKNEAIREPQWHPLKDDQRRMTNETIQLNSFWSAKTCGEQEAEGRKSLSFTLLTGEDRQIKDQNSDIIPLDTNLQDW